MKMKKAKIILALAVTLLAFGSYGASCRKRDRCPSVGQADHGMTQRK